MLNISRKRSYRNSNVQRLDNNITTQSPFNVGEYAKSITDPKYNLRGTQSAVSNLTSDGVNLQLSNYISNYDALGSSMNALAIRNGIVKGILNYFSSLPTYHYNIYPVFNSKDDYKPSGDLKEYLTVADIINKYDISFYAPYFVRRTLSQGMSFFYEISDSSGVVYLEFPLSMCRISHLENGVYRWMIDTSKLTKQLVELPFFPAEIKKAFETKDKSDAKKWADKKYYLLSSKAVAFTFDMSAIVNGGVAISEFASLLPDALQSEKSKDNVELKDDIETVRLIHGKILSDKEGNIKLSSKDAAKWQQLLASGVPDGVAVAVTPFDLENIPLNGAGNSKAYDTVKDSQKQMFKSAGVSSGMFGDETTSSNIVKLAIVKDASWVYTKVLPVIENYYNSVLESIKVDSGSTWKVRMLRQNWYSYADDVARYKDAITLGGSRTDYLASIGMKPIEIYTKLYMEQNILDIDSLMLPKPVSYTMSNNGVGSDKVGRPKTDNPSDDTERISDAD